MKKFIAIFLSLFITTSLFANVKVYPKSNNSKMLAELSIDSDIIENYSVISIIECDTEEEVLEYLDIEKLSEYICTNKLRSLCEYYIIIIDTKRDIGCNTALVCNLDIIYTVRLR